jgi:hypothetical protein
MDPCESWKPIEEGCFPLRCQIVNLDLRAMRAQSDHERARDNLIPHAPVRSYDEQFLGLGI